MSTPSQNQLPILIVDDDDIVLMTLSETIAFEGYKVMTAKSGPQALELIKEQSFAVIVSDQMMPEMTGLELFNQVKQLQPNATRVLITGVLTLKTVIDSVNQGEIFGKAVGPGRARCHCEKCISAIPVAGG